MKGERADAGTLRVAEKTTAVGRAPMVEEGRAAVFRLEKRRWPARHAILRQGPASSRITRAKIRAGGFRVVPPAMVRRRLNRQKRGRCLVSQHRAYVR